MSIAKSPKSPRQISIANWAEILSPEALKNRPNGDKSPNLVTLRHLPIIWSRCHQQILAWHNYATLKQVRFRMFQVTRPVLTKYSTEFLATLSVAKIC